MVAIVSEGFATGDAETPFVARIRIGPIIHHQWAAASLEDAQREADEWLRDWAAKAGMDPERILP